MMYARRSPAARLAGLASGFAAWLFMAGALAQTVLSTAVLGPSTAPRTIVVNPVNGKTYIALRNQETVRVMNAAGVVTTDVDVSAIGFPNALAVDPTNGRVTVGAQAGAGTIDGTTDTFTRTTFFSTPAPASTPVIDGVAALPGNGEAILVDSANNGVWLTVPGSAVLLPTAPAVLACPGPVAVDPATTEIYVANTCGQSVIRVDLFGDSQTFMLAANPVGLGVNPVTRRIYVAEAGSSVDVIDASTATPTLMTPITGFSSPSAIAVDPATDKIYVANAGNGTLTIIDGADNTASSAVVGTNPVGITIDSVRNQVYVLNQGSSNVTVVDGAGIVPPLPLSVGASSNLIASNPLTSRVLVASTANNTLTTIDGRVYTESSLPYAAVATAVNPLTRRAYLAVAGNPGTVEVIDETDDSLIASVPVGANPTHLAIDLALNRIYTTNSTDGTVTAIDGADNTVAGTIAVDASPGAIVVNPSTHKVYVAHPTTGHLRVIDGTNLARTASTVAVGGIPVALAVSIAHNKIYVADASATSTNPVVDGTIDAPAVPPLLGGSSAAASDIAINLVTDRVYVARAGANDVDEYDASSNFPIRSYTVSGPASLAVDKARNRIYAAGGSVLSVIDPAALGLPTVLSEAATLVAVDDYSDRVFVSAGTRTTLVDGQALVDENVSNHAAQLGAGLPAVDAGTGKAYVPSSQDASARVLEEAAPPSLAFDGVGSIAMAGGQLTSVDDPTLEVSPCCAYSPLPQLLQSVNATPDDLYGSASSAGVLETRTSGLSIGLHFMTFFYLDTLAGTTINQQSGPSGATSTMIGRPTMFALLRIPPPAISTSVLATGTLDVPYSQPVVAIGGAGSLLFSVAAGALPDGLSLGSDGTVSGVPTLAGNYTFAVAAVDSSGGSDVATIQMSVVAGTPSIGASPSPVAFGSVLVGQSPSPSVTIVNNGAGTGQVSSAAITAGSDVFTISSNGCTPATQLRHGQSCAIQVSFSPTAQGARTGNLRISTNASNAPIIDVPLTGNGFAEFTLTVSVQGNGSGTVTSSPAGIACPGDCSETYLAGTTVTLTAAAGAGSNNMEFFPCDIKIAFQCMVTMNGDRTVTATFATLTPSLMDLEGWQEVPYVDTSAHGIATVVFDPTTHDFAVQWSLTGLTGTLTGVTIDGPAARGANAAVIHALSTAASGDEHFTLPPDDVPAFEAGQLYLNVTTSGHPDGEIRAQVDSAGAVTVRSMAALTLGSGSGTITGTTEAGDVIVCGSTCTANIPGGKTITFTANPAPGSLFAGWGGACSGAGACQATMNGGKVVSATFNLAAAPTVVLTPSATTLASGASVTLTAALSGGSGTPTGSVTFLDGAATLATVALDGTGHAAFTTSALDVGSHSLSVSYPGDANYAAATSVPVTVTVTGGTDIPRLANISTRMDVLTGNNVMIAGFIIGGSTSKTVAITATGPSLVPFGITNPLANPTLTLVRQSDHAVIATNDDWQTDVNAAQLTSSGFAPTDPREAGLVVTLPPGAYTAIVSGSGGGVGVSVVGVFEIDHPEIPLINISTRGLVQGGNNVMIAGLIVQGSGPQKVVITATGPSLAPFGITNPLANPTLTLVRQSDHTVIGTNDDWQTNTNAADITASGFAPTDPRESALLVTLDPGAYTAIVSGVGGGTGVSVVGVFTVP